MEPKKRGGRGLGGPVGYDALGYTFALIIILFAGAGYLIDRWLGSAPLLTVIGTLSGAALACFWVYLKVRADDGDAHARPGRPDGEDG